MTKSLGTGDVKHSEGQLGLWQQGSKMGKGLTLAYGETNKGKEGLGLQVSSNGTRVQNWDGQSEDLVTVTSQSPVT